MPRPPSYKTSAVRELSRQLSYTPPETLTRILRAAEALIESIESERAYPEEFIVFRLTGYRPDPGDEPNMLVGEALLGDLVVFIQETSRRLNLPETSDERGRAWRIDDIAERLKEDNEILFQVIGRGPRQLLIERLIAERDLDNVQMLPFQSDEMFPYSLSAADLGVVILHESVSRGSVPSKAYNLMSFGIPALYIASKDSELARYCERYGHARCFSAERLDDAASFVRQLASDTGLYQDMQQRAEAAATNFRRGNADRFVDAYLAPASQ